eukprot:9896523-Ditylum_brightwellii.AAC.1
MDPQGMYVITKSMLRRGLLTAFENAEGLNKPQLEPAYKNPSTSLCYTNQQFLPRDGRTLQVTLAEDNLMEILENVVPKSWQGEMCGQRVAGSAKAKLERWTGCQVSYWQQIPRKKRGQEANARSFTENWARKKVAKLCLLHGRGRHMTNEREALRKQVKILQSDKEKNTWSGLANGNGHTQCYNQQELNAIISKSIKAALKKEHKDHAQKEEHNTID